MLFPSFNKLKEEETETLFPRMLITAFEDVATVPGAKSPMALLV